MQEEWRDIDGYEGLYQVSNFGQIRNSKKGKFLTLYVSEGNANHKAYRTTLSNKKARKFFVHRLVAQAFILNPDNKPQVDHIDRDSLNNHVSNSRWVTPNENQINTEKFKTKDFSSTYKGVSRSRNKWRAVLASATFSKHLGTYNCHHAAARKYNHRVLEAFGQYAYLNNVANCDCEECNALKA
jgi:hypothetical protein